MSDDSPSYTLMLLMMDDDGDYVTEGLSGPESQDAIRAVLADRRELQSLAYMIERDPRKLSRSLRAQLKQRAGRPRETDPRDKHLDVRFTETELRCVLHEAKVSGKKPAQWARDILLANASWTTSGI